MDNRILSTLYYKSPDGLLSKIPLVANIPENELDDINDKIAVLKNKLRSIQKNRVTMPQESDIRKSASQCLECDICMVCSGNHRKYDSWPPGQDKCFAFLSKKGKPLRDAPCELCEEHDLELRNYKRKWAQSLTSGSSLKNNLNSLMMQRRELYKKYYTECKVVTE